MLVRPLRIANFRKILQPGTLSDSQSRPRDAHNFQIALEQVLRARNLVDLEERVMGVPKTLKRRYRGETEAPEIACK